MSDKPDNPPAFPIPAEYRFEGTPDEIQIAGAEYGMTLRDYFAGQVLNGAYSRLAIPKGKGELAGCAKGAYAQADAMLAEREKRL